MNESTGGGLCSIFPYKQIDKLHQELIYFLKYSKLYNAELILSKNLPKNDLLEERAV